MELSRKAMGIRPSSTIEISSKANQMKAEGHDVVSFGAGEPDFDTPAHIRQAGIDAINQGKTRYTPAAGTLALREAVCAKLKRDNGLDYEPSQVVIGNGGKHALLNAFMAILNEGDEVIIPAPYWLTYSEMVKIAGGTPVIIHTKKENNYMVTKEELEQAATARTKAFVLNSPSNPTGMIISLDDLKMIAEFAIAHDIFVISDEIYEYLIYDEDKKHVSIASFSPEMYDHTITVNGVSKTYAMTGWRIGYVAAPKPVAKLMSALQSHMTSGPNSIAQEAATAALNGSQECVHEMIAEFKKRRDYIFEREENIPMLSALKPEGAFYLFIDVSGTYGKKYHGKEIHSAADLAGILIEEKYVAAIPCADFGMPDHMRLSYATSMEQIKKGMDRIEEVVRELEA